jgi:hypothetical protein
MNLRNYINDYYKKNRVYLIMISVVLIQGCMKKKCYTCTTTYPMVKQDTLVMSDSMHNYCDLTVEKAKLIENRGTFDSTYSINGKMHTVKTNTICE